MVTTATKAKLRKSNSCVDLSPNSLMRSSIFPRLLTSPLTQLELWSSACWLLERIAHFTYVLRILRHAEKLPHGNSRTLVHGHNSGNKSKQRNPLCDLTGIIA